ncbi:MAG: hypothetical protein HYX54_06290 [Chloroflexi bacterium]|nr:hypothetical protein [Chloroflexota bacterium]
MSARTSIQLIADQDACMRYVITEYVPGAPGLTVPFPIAFRTLNVNPPRSIVPLGMLPVGDWIVRVVVYFSTGTVGQDGTFVERFFRVANSETAVPIPTPVASPRVPCAAPPAGGVAPTLALSVPTGDPVAGTPGLVVPPVTPVRLGDLIEIRVAGDACAIGWVIGATQPNVNNQYELEREDNPGNNPFLFVQNRWRLHDLPTGLLFVSATIRFSADASVTSRWLLDVRGLDVPGARILAPNRAVTAVRTACGASWSFEDATGGYEYCAAEPLPSSLPTLTVAPETPLRVEVPGWTIIGWNGVCGRSDELNSPDVPFLAVDGCDLGGRYPADASASPVRAVFLPRASGPLVRIWLIATRGGETVSWAVYVRIATGS